MPAHGNTTHRAMLASSNSSGDMRTQIMHNGSVVKLNSRRVDMLDTLDPEVLLKRQLAKLRGHEGRPEATNQWQKA